MQPRSPQVDPINAAEEIEHIAYPGYVQPLVDDVTSDEYVSVQSDVDRVDGIDDFLEDDVEAQLLPEEPCENIIEPASPLQTSLRYVSLFRSNERKKNLCHPALTITAQLALLGAFALAMEKIFGLSAIIKPNYYPLYANALIPNTKMTCGGVYWLDVDICHTDTITNLLPYADYICDFAAKNLCINQPLVDFYTGFYNYDIHGVCKDFYPLNDYSQWQSIMGSAAWYCYSTAKHWCDYKYTDASDLLNEYLMRSVDGSNQTLCRDILPLKSLCDYVSYESTPAYQCGVAAQAISNNYLPYNYSYFDNGCDTMFPNLSACDYRQIWGPEMSFCVDAATNACDAQHKWRANLTFIFISIAATCLTLALGYLLLRRYFRNPPKRNFGEMPDVEKDEIREFVKEKANVELQDDHSTQYVQKTLQEIKEQPELQHQQREAFLGGIAKVNIGNPVNSFSQQDTNLDVRERIFWYARLWREKVNVPAETPRRLCDTRQCF